MMKEWKVQRSLPNVGTEWFGSVGTTNAMYKLPWDYLSYLVIPRLLFFPVKFN